MPDYLTVKDRIEQPHKADERKDNPKPVNTVAEGNFTDNKEHNRVNSHTQQAGQIVFGKGHGYSQKSDRQNKFNQWMNLVHPLVPSLQACPYDGFHIMHCQVCSFFLLFHAAHAFFFLKNRNA